MSLHVDASLHRLPRTTKLAFELDVQIISPASTNTTSFFLTSSSPTPSMTASSSAPIDTLEPSASGVKYPDRQSLPGSASRNVPLLVSEIAPLVRPHSRVLEIAAGHGLLTATLAKQCREKGVEGVKWEAREADEELVRVIGETCTDAGVEGVVEARAWEIDDQDDESKQSGDFDLVIIANLVHIVPWKTVQSLFEKLGWTIVRQQVGAKVCVYGAFNEEGRFTSEGNERVSRELKVCESRLVRTDGLTPRPRHRSLIPSSSRATRRTA